jgi:hypothetical protein
LLTETSDEDLETFFRSGWAHMALPPRESSVRRPWDPSPWDGDIEAYREVLYAGMAFGMSDVRAFARERLGVPLPTDFRIKTDHPTVRKMVRRGRKARKAALGEDGWKEQVQG